MRWYPASMARGLYIETVIDGPLDRVWELTQSPSLHERWDLRFTSITYSPRASEADPQRFTYSTRIGFGLAVEGMGESVVTRTDAKGVRSSSLRFWSEHPISLIVEGSGYWQYVPLAKAPAETLRFLTWYDYKTRYGLLGRAADMIFRPLMGWATAWSFDRLRLWVEQDVPPEAVRDATLTYTVARLGIIFVWLWHGLVPKLLYRDKDERILLREAGLEERWLPLVGAAEVAMGLAGLLLWRRRGYLLLTGAAMVLTLPLVALRSPRYLKSAFNPVTLNFCVVTLAAVAWFSWRNTAFAGRCLRRAPQKEAGRI